MLLYKSNQITLKLTNNIMYETIDGLSGIEEMHAQANVRDELDEEYANEDDSHDREDEPSVDDPDETYL